VSHLQPPPRKRLPLPVRPHGVDALPVLVVYVVALYGIPSVLVVGPLGAAGAPAQIIGILMLLWWLAAQLILIARPQRGNPVHWLLLAFAVAVVASYAAGMSRPVLDSLEVRSADRAMLSLCAWCGVLLVISDGISTRARLERLIRVVAGGATFIAVLGMLQFFFALDLAHFIKIPGLSVNSAFGELFDRSGYRRVSGTTSHPIEFGVVLAATLPLVLHTARFTGSRVAARWWWAAVMVVAISLPLSVARSAIIGGAIDAMFLFHTWPGWLKRRALVVGVIGAGLMSVVVPGLLGTIRGLFLNAGSDPSTQGRTADYAPVAQYVVQHPFLGRGFGTFIPDLYRTLDNQYLGLLVETGFLGLLAFLALVFGTVTIAGRIRRSTQDPRTRDLAQCLKAGIVVITVDAATFDAFGFAVCVGTLFLLLGIVAMLWHTHERDHPLPQPRTVRAEQPGRRALRIGGLIASVGIVFCLLVGLARVAVPETEFQAQAAVLLVPPQGEDQTAFSRSGNATLATSVLHDVVVSPVVRAELAKTAPGEYEVAIGDGSLMMGTDVPGYGPTMRIAASGDTAAAAKKTLEAVIRQTHEQLAAIQRRTGVPDSEAIAVRVAATNPPHEVVGRRSRAFAAALALLTLCGVAGFIAMSGGILQRPGRRRSRPRSADPATRPVPRRPRESV
jgi:O-antigen ligase